MTLYRIQVPSPIGALCAVADDAALVGVYMEQHAHAPEIAARDGQDHPVLVEARAQLDAYFAGARRRFALPLAPAGTGFQRTVWQALLEIPHGETWTYGALAAHIGHPGAARAVGAANGRNPISVIVPCHRVIGARGALTGYAGGIARKQWLLRHERGLRGPARGSAAL